MKTTRELAIKLADAINELTYSQMMDICERFVDMGAGVDLSKAVGWAELLSSFSDAVDGMEFNDDDFEQPE